MAANASGGFNFSISNSVVRHAGNGAIFYYAGDRVTLTGAGHEVAGSTISYSNRYLYCYVPMVCAFAAPRACGEFILLPTPALRWPWRTAATRSSTPSCLGGRTRAPSSPATTTRSRTASCTTSSRRAATRAPCIWSVRRRLRILVYERRTSPTCVPETTGARLDLPGQRYPQQHVSAHQHGRPRCGSLCERFCYLGLGTLPPCHRRRCVSCVPRRRGVGLHHYRKHVH